LSLIVEVTVDLLWLDWKFLTFYVWDFAQLLLALVRGSRPESTTVDRHIALNDAHQLNKVFLGKSGNEETLIRIFCTRSQQQLTATLNYYHQHYGHEFEKVALLLSSLYQECLMGKDLQRQTWFPGDNNLGVVMVPISKESLFYSTCTFYVLDCACLHEYLKPSYSVARRFSSVKCLH
jgi:hypothetical protein